MDVKAYLEQWGYLKKEDTIEKFGFGLHKAFVSAEGQPEEQRIREGIMSFQRYNSLKVTGELDGPTLQLMERPRCGFPDVGSFTLWSEKWPSPMLTYQFAQDTSKMPTAAQRDAFRQALQLWADVSKLQFSEGSNAQLQVRFVGGEHGDGSPFDGSGNVLAHAFFPTQHHLGGDCHFDDAENWVLSGSGIDYITVAAHELGHALGLAHSSVKDSLMYPYYGGPHRFLHEDDIAGIQALYGARVTPPPPEPKPPAPEPPKPEPADDWFDVMWSAVAVAQHYRTGTQPHPLDRERLLRLADKYR